MGTVSSRANGVERKRYFERGNTSLMESWQQLFNSSEGSTGTVSLGNKYGRGERI
jgi:hypothetical protein